MDSTFSKLTAEPVLLTYTEAAQLCNLGVRTLYRLVGEKKAPSPLAIGGSRRFRRSDIMQWVAAGCPAIAERAAQ